MTSKLHGLACLLFTMCLLLTLSSGRQHLTVTGAERLFGKNKISDAHCRWKEIYGDHFRGTIGDAIYGSG